MSRWARGAGSPAAAGFHGLELMEVLEGVAVEAALVAHEEVELLVPRDDAVREPALHEVPVVRGGRTPASAPVVAGSRGVIGDVALVVADPARVRSGRAA